MGRKIIDAHYHIGHWYLPQDDDNCYLTMKKYQKESDISNITLQSLSSYINTYRPIVHNIIAALIKLNDDTFYAYPTLHYPITPVNAAAYDESEFYNQVKMFEEIGFDGIKMLEGKPNMRKGFAIPLNDPLYDKYYSYLEENKIPIMFHVADPDDFWDEGREYGDGTFLSKEELYAEALSVLESHKNLTVIFAHCFFMAHEPKRLCALLDKYPNMYFDLTPGPIMYEHFTRLYDEWREIFNKYSDRIIFGTDASSDASMEIQNGLVYEMRRFLETDDTFDSFNFYDMSYIIKGFKLDDTVLDKIYYDNFKKLVKEPKKINVEALIKYIELNIEKIPESKIKDTILKFYNENK